MRTHSFKWCAIWISFVCLWSARRLYFWTAICYLLIETYFSLGMMDGG